MSELFRRGDVFDHDLEIWVELGRLIPVEAKKVGGTYDHPWNCHNCHTDHGGEECENPDFGEWHQYYQIDALKESDE